MSRIDNDFITENIDLINSEFGNTSANIGSPINIYKFRIVSGIQIITKNGEIKPKQDIEGNITYSVVKEQQYVNVITGNEPITIVWENATKAFNLPSNPNEIIYNFKVGTYYKSYFLTNKIVEKEDNEINIFGNDFKTTFDNKEIQLRSTEWEPNEDDLNLFFYIVVDKTMDSFQLLELTSFEKKYNISTKEFINTDLNFKSINLKYSSSGSQILDFIQFGALGFGYPFPKEKLDKEGNIIVDLDIEKSNITGVDTIQLDLITTGALSSIAIFGGVYDKTKPGIVPIPQRLFLHESLFPQTSSLLFQKPNMNYYFQENAVLSLSGFYSNLQENMQAINSFSGYNVGDTKTVNGGVRVSPTLETSNPPTITKDILTGATLYIPPTSYSVGDLVYKTRDNNPFDISKSDQLIDCFVSQSNYNVGHDPILKPYEYESNYGGTRPTLKFYWKSAGLVQTTGTNKLINNNEAFISINQDYDFNMLGDIKSIVGNTGFNLSIPHFLNLNSYANFYIDELVSETSETTKLTVSNYLGSSLIGPLFSILTNGLVGGWTKQDINRLGQPLNLLIPSNVWDRNNVIMKKNGNEYIDINFFIDDKEVQLNPIPLHNLCSFMFSITNLIKDTSQVKEGKPEGKGGNGIWDTKYLGQTQYENGEYINSDQTPFKYNAPTTTTVKNENINQTFIIDYINFKAIYSGDVRLSAFLYNKFLDNYESKYSSYFSTKSKMRKYPNIIGNEIKFNYWNEFNTIGQNVNWPIIPDTNPDSVVPYLEIKSLKEQFMFSKGLFNRSSGGLWDYELDFGKQVNPGQTINLINKNYFGESKSSLKLRLETNLSDNTSNIYLLKGSKRVAMPYKGNELRVITGSEYTAPNLVGNTFYVNLFSLVGASTKGKVLEKFNTILFNITDSRGRNGYVIINLNTFVIQNDIYYDYDIDWKKEVTKYDFVKWNNGQMGIVNPHLFPTRPPQSSNAKKMYLYFDNESKVRFIRLSATWNENGVLEFGFNFNWNSAGGAGGVYLTSEDTYEPGIWQGALNNYIFFAPNQMFADNDHFPYEKEDMGIIKNAYLIKK